MNVVQNKWQNKEWECYKEPGLGKMNLNWRKEEY